MILSNRLGKSQLFRRAWPISQSKIEFSLCVPLLKTPNKSFSFQPHTASQKARMDVIFFLLKNQEIEAHEVVRVQMHSSSL